MNFKTIVTLILFFLATSVSAQTTVSGEGRFYAGDDDSLSFVKAQLHYQAVRDVISKELKSMGLDDKVFWQRYESKFSEYFQSVEKQLKEKYADASGEVPKDKKLDYEKALRAKKLEAMSRYGRIQGVITSYSVKRMTRSPQNPQSRFYQIEAKTDRRSVNELYIKFTSDEADRKYTTLFVTVDFALSHMTWTDTGVEVGSDFTDVVRDHWRKWLENKFTGQIDEIVFTDDTMQRQLREFLLIPRDIEFNQRLENGDSSLSRYGTGLWLKISMKMDKLREDELLKKREISIDGDVLMIELRTNRSIAQSNFEPEKKLFHTEEAKSFSSSLASMVYSKPLPAFEEARRATREISMSRQDFHLKVASLTSIQDLLDVGTLLTNKGVVHQARTEVVGFDGSKGVLNISFRGGRQNLTSFLRGITGAPLGNGKVLQVNPEKPTEMTLMVIEQNEQPTKNSKTSI
ncbi:MAG: hypothetical protein CME71_00115 [Halobacteriovorax sp.]|nr:hypothetical protein [Halobacteriovorax sp.]